MRDAVRRECRAARTAVAVMDVSTLGKIDVRGKDAVWFLDQLYVNSISTIPVGKARYSVMCRLDGSVLDDGIVMRTGEQRFFVTASTGHAAAVLDWMEEWLQTEWPQPPRLRDLDHRAALDRGHRRSQARARCSRPSLPTWTSSKECVPISLP